MKIEHSFQFVWGVRYSRGPTQEQGYCDQGLAHMFRVIKIALDNPALGRQRFPNELYDANLPGFPTTCKRENVAV